MMTNIDMCSCCGEIWNRDNQKQIFSLGKYSLHLCPDCYNEYIKRTPLDKIRSEIEKVFCMSVVTNELRTPMEVKTEILQIIDKYKAESEE